MISAGFIGGGEGAAPVPPNVLGNYQLPGVPPTPAAPGMPTPGGAVVNLGTENLTGPELVNALNATNAPTIAAINANTEVQKANGENTTTQYGALINATKEIALDNNKNQFFAGLFALINSAVTNVTGLIANKQMVDGSRRVAEINEKGYEAKLMADQQLSSDQKDIALAAISTKADEDKAIEATKGSTAVQLNKDTQAAMTQRASLGVLDDTFNRGSGGDWRGNYSNGSPLSMLV